MCDNIIVLYIFILLKIIALIVLPIMIIIKRKQKISKILIIIDIIMLLFFLICNVFTINSCVYNSNIDGIKRVNNKNAITLYNEIHPKLEENYSFEGIESNTNYKTINNSNFYYFNQNNKFISNAYYTCNNKKVYMNTFGSSITSLSMVISTLYNTNINPVQIFDFYYEDNKDKICTNIISIENIFSSIIKRYGAIQLNKIDSTQLNSVINNGGLVIARLSANEKSKLTCDSNYIVVYNISLDGNYMIAIPNQTNYDYVCPYSSRAYGNIIKSDNMEKSWTLDELNNETIQYYSIRKE